MPTFDHSFKPASADPLGPEADLTIEQIETAGLLEVLQTPGVALGNWKILEALLEPGEKRFLFREPLGQAREVKTAVSGLFGRFVARAYVTEHLKYMIFTHVNGNVTPLDGTVDAEIRRVRGSTGDMPDWGVWGDTRGRAIVEAKGSHDPRGPGPTLRRAEKQAKRAEILVRGRRASFKRFAIVTRWGIASLGSTPMLYVKDPDETGDSDEHADRLALGFVRRHCAALLRSLGHEGLSAALWAMTEARSAETQNDAQSSARARFDSAPSREVEWSGVGALPEGGLIGGFVTRAGPIGGFELSPVDQEVLSRAAMRPTFVGLDRPTLKAAIEGDVERIGTLQTIAAVGRAGTENAPVRNDGGGAWVVRADADGVRIR